MKTDLPGIHPTARQSLAILIAVALALHPAVAQPEASRPQANPPTVIQLKDSPPLKDVQTAIYQGEVATTPHIFTLDGLSVLTPVSVTLACEPGSGLKLKISKVAEEPLREGGVGPEGTVGFTFKTEGGFIAKVSGPGKQTPYRLAVMAGKEAKPKLFPPTMSYKDFEKHETKLPIGERIKALGTGKPAAAPPAVAAAAVAPPSGIQSSLLWAIFAVLVVIAALLGFLAFRKKS
jgi:hypothetical protein